MTLKYLLTTTHGLEIRRFATVTQISVDVEIRVSTEVLT